MKCINFLEKFSNKKNLIKIKKKILILISNINIINLNLIKIKKNIL